MQFMVVYHPGPEGLGVNNTLRWQHGPTPGVKVVTGWVSTAVVGNGDDGMADGRIYLVIETDSAGALAAFVNWMRPYNRQIEVRPVTDFLPNFQAMEARNPEQVPRAPGQTDEQRARVMELQRRYMAAGSAAEAVEIWRTTPGAGKEIMDGLRIRDELDQITAGG